MTADLFMALVAFAFVTSVTPGPNNLMLLASGVNHGFVRSLPHMLGVGLGFGFMIVTVGLGLSQVFAAYPVLYTALRAAGAAYMLYLAWKIVRSGPVGEGKSSGRPMTFLGAAAFQWVNPKAWIMAVSAIATYTLPQNYLWTLLLVSLVFVAVNIPSIASWVAFGTGLRRFLNDPRYLRIFNITMAVLLVVSLAPILWH
jgi:threonine/homoserine/homoserine lactone efflux protein